MVPAVLKVENESCSRRQRERRSSTTDGDDDSDQSTPMVIDSESVEERESNERRIEERDGFSVTRKENEDSVEEAKI
ncbi:hypothetical protein OIU79_005722 [Salix purpurea]|uniref:Uncharacterized protein n=1 Tax=Salix purpurea TaxID=77065 RepID=A0A9Q0Z1F7_SALPP|nr:hypothetical protein OIU79_005722 [Salix purpurea]